MGKGEIPEAVDHMIVRLAVAPRALKTNSIFVQQALVIIKLEYG
jgi:hypothetical protein